MVLLIQVRWFFKARALKNESLSRPGDAEWTPESEDMSPLRKGDSGRFASVYNGLINVGGEDPVTDVALAGILLKQS